MLPFKTLMMFFPLVPTTYQHGWATIVTYIQAQEFFSVRGGEVKEV